MPCWRGRRGLWQRNFPLGPQILMSGKPVRVGACGGTAGYGRDAVRRAGSGVAAKTSALCGGTLGAALDFPSTERCDPGARRQAGQRRNWPGLRGADASELRLTVEHLVFWRAETVLSMLGNSRRDCRPAFGVLLRIAATYADGDEGSAPAGRRLSATGGGDRVRLRYSGGAQGEGSA